VFLPYLQSRQTAPKPLHQAQGMPGPAPLPLQDLQSLAPCCLHTPQVCTGIVSSILPALRPTLLTVRTSPVSCHCYPTPASFLLTPYLSYTAYLPPDPVSLLDHRPHAGPMSVFAPRVHQRPVDGYPVDIGATGGYGDS
jgi:hypothetical protein